VIRNSGGGDGGGEERGEAEEDVEGMHVCGEMPSACVFDILMLLVLC
jgi:hypothetical protein